MSASRAKTAVLAALLTALGAAAFDQGIGPTFASAAPRAALPSRAMTSTTEQSLPVYPANADADVGPGQCEPVLVGAR